MRVRPAPRFASHCQAARSAAAGYRPRSAISRDGQHLWRARKIRSVVRQECGLTLRSRRGPTAGHQARAGGTRYIFTGPGLASCRRSRLTSNVRPRNETPCSAPANPAPCGVNGHPRRVLRASEHAEPTAWQERPSIGATQVGRAIAHHASRNRPPRVPHCALSHEVRPTTSRIGPTIY
jgi:hypothetical protein